jgi:DNA adenine methylase
MTHCSPLRYPGGKATLAPFLAATIRANRLQPAIFVEPCAGGAGAAISLLLREHVVEVILNDIDPLIYCFWKSVFKDSDEFCNRIERAPLTVDYWRRQKLIATRNSYRRVNSVFTVGFAAFFLNRCNRSGVFNGGPIGGLDQTGTYKIDARFNKTDLIERIQRIAQYRERVRVYNFDAVHFLRRVQKGYFGKVSRMLVYLDPPFFQKGPCLYNFAFADDGHKRLAAFLNKDAKFKWAISYDDWPEIQRIYRRQARNIVNMNYQVHTRRLGRELLISSMNCQLPDEWFEPTTNVNNGALCAAS